MRFARHLPFAATLLAALTALAIPAGAGAHSAGLGAGDAPIDPAAAAELGAEQARALAELPRETAVGTCRSTEEVAGLGDACRTDDGVFRVQLADGSTVTTHGTDAPRDPSARLAAAAHLPDSQAALNGASVADIQCVTAPGDRRVELVYARPSDKADRSASMAAPMRQAIYQASAFVDAEAQALDETQGRRIPVLCEGGVPKVHVVTLRATGTGGGDYSSIVNDLVAQGFPQGTSNTASLRRFMVFYDDEAASGAAGVGGMWIDDEQGVGNLNNLGARYAVEFDWGSSHLPHWDVFLHEISHNMGAVADGAPDSSEAGHCIDGLDIMCYDDGGSGGTYSSSICTVERYDCGADSYFHPSPATGSYLDTHWNVGSPDNRWLVVRDLGWDDQGVPDTTPPTAPGSPSVSAVTTTSMTVSWGASTDLRSAVRYRVAVDRFDGSSWQQHATIQPVSQSSTVVSGLATGTPYRIGVTAYDRAGNTSAAATVEATTAFAPPTAPASAALSLVDTTTLSAAGVAGTATAGIRGYEVELQRGIDAWTRVGEVAGGSTQLTGLDAGASYRVRVRTVANGGVASGWRTSLYVATPTPPRVTTGAEDGGDDGTIAPPTVSVTVAGPTRAIATWTASPGASAWVVSYASTNGGSPRTFVTSVTSASLLGLAPGTAYTVSVAVSNAVGDALSAAGTDAFVTPRDTAAPGTSRFGSPRFVGTTMRISWTRAVDNAAVARYRLERRVGRRWVNVPLRGTAITATLAGVRRGSLTTLRVRAFDASGNAGRWTTTSFRRR